MLGQLEHRLAGRVEARRRVVGQLERLRRLCVELDLILDCGDGRDVGGIDRIDQHPHRDKDPRRLKLANRQVVLARVVKERLM